VDAATFNASTAPQLEAAIEKANANSEANTIVLAPGTYVPENSLVFTGKSGTQTVEGPASAPGASVSGVGEKVTPSHLFDVEKGTSVAVKNVRITLGGGGATSGIEDVGSLDIESSALVGNRGFQVVVQPESTLTARNSTISDGATFGVVNAGTASFTNDTVAFNKEGGIENKGKVNLTNTIVAENKGGDCIGSANTSDHSLDSDGSCGVGALSKMNPLLGTLVNDGGPTPIHSLKAGSPAIDAGDAVACPATDQRGQARPDVASTACDIGADEFNATPPILKVPASIKTTATSAEGAEVEYNVDVTSSDDAVKLSGCTTTVEELPVGASVVGVKKVFPVGSTEVTCEAVDGHEATAKGSFMVTVEPRVVAKAPTAETKPATSITATSATVNAMINPNGSEVTECKFEYGTTTSYGKTAPCSASPGSGMSPVAVSASLGALSANTTNDFRIVAKNAGGEGMGSNETFKTLEEEVEVVTQPAAAVRQLLEEVGSAEIPRRIRSQLTHLLRHALGSLGDGDCGAQSQMSPTPVRARRHQCRLGRACQELEQFVELIRRDQRRRRPGIPASLASAWSQSAHNIEATLGCESNEPSDGDSDRR
jgi:hypothetical protein